MAHVVVVGAGVLGSAAAWRLAARGHTVTVLERFGPGHDNGGSHGSARIFRLAYPDALHVDLAVRSLPLWRRLEHDTGRAVLTLTGGLDHGPVAATGELLAALAAAGQAAEAVPPAAAARRWPHLRFDTSVVFHPDAGRLHADDVVDALRAAAVALGARWRFDTRVRGLRRRADGRVEVVTGAGATVADVVVVAAGGWTGPLLRPPGVDPVVAGLPDLVVTQEQPLHFAAPDALAWPSFIHHPGAALPAGHGRAAYGLGSADGVKVGLHGVGAPVDPDRRDRGLDPVVRQRVVDYAVAWLPGLGDPTSATAVTCLYTNTPDHDFVVDRAGPVVVLAGCSGHAFKFAPVLGDLVTGLVEGVAAPSRFRLGRPG